MPTDLLLQMQINVVLIVILFLYAHVVAFHHTLFCKDANAGSSYHLSCVRGKKS